MIASVRISNAAEADLRGIFEYIAYQLNSMKSAQRILRGLLSAVSKLSNNPERWSPYPHEPWLSRGVRTCIVGSYVIFFSHVDGIVSVVRVLYCRRDFESALEESTH